ncbi:thiamine pyrophosphokinase [Entophlyctis helioformis]|nr:thiamine pyrophosphokinase [Entophlyctis helioformis]
MGQEWRVYDFFASEQLAENAQQRALLVLNQPLCNLALLKTIWDNVSIRICADGGANRLYDSLGSDELRSKMLPDAIRGDLDSLRADVRQFYESKGIAVLKDPSQDTTDFQKCLEYLVQREQAEGSAALKDLLVLGATSGRLDQTLASIATLFKIEKTRRTYLVSNDSICWLLLPTGSDLSRNAHQIFVRKGFEGPCCGVVSLGYDAHCVTTGLKWNLHAGMTLNFDKLVSTSNAFGDDAATAVESVSGSAEYLRVTVANDQPVLWTVEVNLH